MSTSPPVSSGPQPTRQSRVDATRTALLDAAERLFAEHGVLAVSNRQVGEAAGQGNNTAVGYHFGGKADLVRAIVRRHTQHVEQLRREMLAQIEDETSVRAWVDCLVRPMARHLDSLGAPTWYARFCAQLAADPQLRQILEDEAREAPSLHELIAGLERTRPEMPDDVRAERDEMVRSLLTIGYAVRERNLAHGLPTPRATWDDAATGVADAVTGLWQAPWTVRP